MIAYKEFKERYQESIVVEYYKIEFNLDSLTAKIAKELKEKNLGVVKSYIVCARQSHKSWLTSS